MAHTYIYGAPKPLYGALINMSMVYGNTPKGWPHLSRIAILVSAHASITDTTQSQIHALFEYIYIIFSYTNVQEGKDDQSLRVHILKTTKQPQNFLLSLGQSINQSVY